MSNYKDAINELVPIRKLEQETRALREALAQTRAAILEHEHCNSYDCGDCIGAILAASPGAQKEK